MTKINRDQQCRLVEHTGQSNLLITPLLSTEHNTSAEIAGDSGKYVPSRNCLQSEIQAISVGLF